MQRLIKEKNKYKRLCITFLLFLVSVILKYSVGLFSIAVMTFYYIVSVQWGKGLERLSDWLENMALSNDQHGNVVNSVMFGFLFKKYGGEEFGNPDDTVSYVIARNKYQGNLKWPGKILAFILNKIDPKDGGHMKKAIEAKKRSDLEASKRYDQNEYYD